MPGPEKRADCLIFQVISTASSRTKNGDSNVEPPPLKTKFNTFICKIYVIRISQDRCIRKTSRDQRCRDDNGSHLE